MDTEPSGLWREAVSEGCSTEENRSHCFVSTARTYVDLRVRIISATSYGGSVDIFEIWSQIGAVT
jgi:hypothetical protein